MRKASKIILEKLPNSLHHIGEGLLKKKSSIWGILNYSFEMGHVYFC